MSDNNDINALIEAMTQMVSGFGAATERLESNMNELSSSVSRVTALLNSQGARGTGGGSTAGANGPATVTDTDTINELRGIRRELSTIRQQNSDANNNANPPGPPTSGDTRPLYTAGQLAEMARHRESYDSRRVVSDIPTFATYGTTLQPSPLSTLQRSRDLLGINLGLSDRARPGQFPSHDNGVDIGVDLRTFLRGNENLIRTLQGSLGKSYEYSQNQGQILDDSRNTANAKAALQDFYRDQESKGTPLSLREKGLFEVGLNERGMRENAQITSMATNSLSRFVSAHQSGAIKYSPFISMDSTGPSGTGAAGSTVSTRRFMKTDTIGSYAQGLIDSMQRIDAVVTASDVRTSAVNDVKSKVTQTRDRIAASLAPTDMLDRLGRIGIDTASKTNVQELTGSQRRSSDAQNRLMELNARQAELRIQANEIQTTRGDRSTEFRNNAAEQARVQREMQQQERIVSQNQPIYQSRVNQLMSNFSMDDIRKMSNSGDTTLQQTGELLRQQARLQHGQNVLAGTEQLTTAEKVQSKMQDMGGGASEFAASMMKNLQWSLMFAFSGTVFQALSQIPTQATYETITPMYSGVANLTGISPLQQQFTQFGAQAPAIMADLQSRTNSLQALLGSQSASDRAVSTALEISKSQPIQFGEAMEVMTAMSTYPSTKGQATNPEFQKTMFENVQLLSMLAPEQGTGGALFAIREMLGGQFRSLQMRFNMSPELMASYAGVSASQMKSQSGVNMMYTMNEALMGMFGGSEILMRRGAEGSVQMKNITDTLTSSIIRPMVTDANPKVTSMLDRMLSSGTKEDPFGGASKFLAISQREAISNASLQSIATLSGLKFEKGETVESLARKRTDKTGGDYGENLAFIQSQYTQGVQSNVKSIYGTTAGAQALTLSGINVGLGNVMEAFNPANGLSSIFTSFLGNYDKNLETFNKRDREAIDAGDDAGRQEAASKFIKDFMEDVQESIRSAAAGLNTGPFTEALKQVTDTVRIGAEAVFAPIGETIMAQTFKTAIGIPGLMVGGAISTAGSELVGGVGNVISGVTNIASGGGQSGDAIGALLRGSGNMADTMAWVSGISNLKTSPLGAASKFAGWSMLSRGATQLEEGDGLGGLGAIAAGLALNVLPNIIPKSMDKWVDNSINKMARQGTDIDDMPRVQRTGLSFPTIGAAGGRPTGAVYSSIPNITNPPSRLSRIGAGVSASLGLVEAATVLSDYRGGERSIRGATGAGFRAATSIAGSAVGNIGMVGTGIAALTLGSGLLDSEEERQNKNMTEKVGEVTTALGGFASIIGVAVPQIGLFGMALSAIGSVITYIGGRNKEEEKIKNKEAEQQSENVYLRTVTDPKQAALKLGGTEFDTAVENYRLRDQFSSDELSAMRLRNQEYNVFAEKQSEKMVGVSEDIFIEELKKNPKKADLFKEENSADLEKAINQHMSKAQPIISKYQKSAFDTPEQVFALNKDNKPTDKVDEKIKKNMMADLTERDVDVDVAKKIVDALVKSIESGAGDAKSIKEAVGRDANSIGKQVGYNTASEYWFQDTKFKVPEKDVLGNYKTLNMLPETIAENVGKANTLQQQSSSMVGMLYSSGIGLWNMDMNKVQGFEKMTGAYEAKMLEGGHIKPEQLMGPEGAAIMMRVTEAVGAKRAEELGQMNIDKQLTGLTKNMGQYMKMSDEGTLPSAFSSTMNKEIEAFNSAVTQVGSNASSAAGNLESVAEALAKFTSDISNMGKVQEEAGKSTPAAPSTGGTSKTGEEKTSASETPTSESENEIFKKRKTTLESIKKEKRKEKETDIESMTTVPDPYANTPESGIDLSAFSGIGKTIGTGFKKLVEFGTRHPPEEEKARRKEEEAKKLSEKGLQNVSTGSDIGIDTSALKQTVDINNFDNMSINDKMKAAGVDLGSPLFSKGNKEIPVPTIKSDQLSKNLTNMPGTAPTARDVFDLRELKADDMLAEGGKGIKPEVLNKTAKTLGSSNVEATRLLSSRIKSELGLNPAGKIVGIETPEIDTTSQKGITEGVKQDSMSMYAQIQAPKRTKNEGLEVNIPQEMPMSRVMELANANKGTAYSTPGGLQFSVPTPAQAKRDEMMGALASRYSKHWESLPDHPTGAGKDEFARRVPTAPRREEGGGISLSVDKVTVLSPTRTDINARQ